MRGDDRFGLWGRALALIFLVSALFGTLIWYDTVSYDPERNDFPEDGAIAPMPEAYVGERVTLRGEIIGIDPVVIAITHDDSIWRVTLEDAPEARLRGDPLKPGAEMAAHGTLTDPNTLATDRAVTRLPWARTYMYAISIVGAVWVLARAYTGWQFDRDRIAIVPRERQPATDASTASTDGATEPSATDRSEGKDNG